ncbi:hypothetical protein P692DRAFT_20828814 [Suillus brevipes Sb2]|nr:hypothetical protein P692DRAFT_20828814 [Suillus brevipes Sb2]
MVTVTIFSQTSILFCMFQAQCHVLHDLHHDRGRHMILMLSKYSWELAMNRRGASMNDIIRHSRYHGEKFQVSKWRAQLSGGVQNQIQTVVRIRARTKPAPMHEYHELGLSLSINERGRYSNSANIRPSFIPRTTIFRG